MRTPSVPILLLIGIWVPLLLFTPPDLCAQEETINLSDAVMKTLRSHPGVSIQAEHIVQKEGELQSASGQFDWVGLASFSKEDKRYHFTDSEEKAAALERQLIGQRFLSDSWLKETTQYSVGVRKATRSGVAVIPSLSALDLEDPSTNTFFQTRSDMGVEILIPLLRGLGEESAAAVEKAARSALTAGEWESKHNISGQILETAVAYWSSLGAMEVYKVLLDTGKRADEINSLVELLIRGGEAAPPALYQARAKLLQRKADIRDAELSYYQSRQRLALALGYSPQEMNVPPRPEGPFPPVVVPDALNKDREAAYVAHALDQRADFLAALNNITTQEILLRKAELDKKPRLDLDVSAGMTGLSERENTSRYWRALSNDTAGPGAFVGLKLEWPIANNTAIGEFIRRRSLLREAQLTSSQLSNTIASDVHVAMEKLRSYAQEYRLASESVEAYQEAVKFENQKVRTGDSTLNALIDLEDRYFEARITQLRAQQNYAVALAGLRFNTGTLLTEDARNFKFKPNSLLILPLIGEP
jgi:outer membrane protein